MAPSPFAVDVPTTRPGFVEPVTDNQRPFALPAGVKTPFHCAEGSNHGARQRSASAGASPLRAVGFSTNSSHPTWGKR
eukprot:8226771-Karenia_brevis.AAC.1